MSRSGLPRARFSFEKVFNRTAGDNPSLYLGTNHQTGEKALYVMEHTTKSLPDAAGITLPKKPNTMDKLEWRKKRHPSGNTAVIKHAHKIMPPLRDGSTAERFKHLLTDSSTSLPTDVALKCYDPKPPKTTGRFEKNAHNGETFLASKGEFACVFRHNRKLFFAMEWIEGSELFDVLIDASRPKLTAPELLLLFKGYFAQIDLMHKTTGLPFNDLKPENIMAQPKTGKPRKLNPVDVDSIGSSMVTESYLSIEDYRYLLKHGEINASFACDYRTLANVFAVACYWLTSKYLSYDAFKIREQDRYIAKATTEEEDGIADSRAILEDRYHRRIVHQTFARLKAGENPFTEPTAEFEMYQIRRDIHLLLMAITQHTKKNKTKLAADNPLLTQTPRVKTSIIALLNGVDETDITAHKAVLLSLVQQLLPIMPDVIAGMEGDLFYYSDYQTTAPPLTLGEEVDPSEATAKAYKYK